jgi:hypothetical protein
MQLQNKSHRNRVDENHEIAPAPRPGQDRTLDHVDEADLTLPAHDPIRLPATVAQVGVAVGEDEARNASLAISLPAAAQVDPGVGQKLGDELQASIKSRTIPQIPHRDLRRRCIHTLDQYTKTLLLGARPLVTATPQVLPRIRRRHIRNLVVQVRMSGTSYFKTWVSFG